MKMSKISVATAALALCMGASSAMAVTITPTNTPFSAKGISVVKPGFLSPVTCNVEFVGTTNNNNTATITAASGGFALQVLIADVPVSHPQAVGPYRIRIWAEQDGASPVLLADGIPTVNPFQWTGAIASNGTTNVYVALVDPLGRESPTTVKEVVS